MPTETGFCANLRSWESMANEFGTVECGVDFYGEFFLAVQYMPMLSRRIRIIRKTTSVCVLTLYREFGTGCYFPEEAFVEVK